MNILSCFYSFLFLCLLTFIASPHSCFAQRIEGRIFSEDGEGLAFATVHQKYTTHGTTSNANGFYSLELQNDTATVIFQYVGYQTIEKIVADGNSILKVDVHMIPDVVELEAVVVKPGLEDPAFAIIRKGYCQNRKKASQGSPRTTAARYMLKACRDWITYLRRYWEFLLPSIPELCICQKACLTTKL